MSSMLVRLNDRLPQLGAVGRDIAGVFERPNLVAAMYRRGRSAWLRASFVTYISFVMTVALIYYMLIATPIYQSETQLGVRSKDAIAAVPTLAAFTGLSNGAPDCVAVGNYIQSPDMFDALDRIYNLKKMYSEFRPDLFNHLPRDAWQEEYVKYFQTMVLVVVDSDNNILTVDVKAFDAKTAHDMAHSIMELSSAFASDLSAQMRDESLRSSSKDLADAQRDYQKTTVDISKFRATVGNLDPTALGAASSGAVIAMQAQIYGLNTQLASLKTYATESAPEVQQLKAQIKSLQDQIDVTNKSLAGQGLSDTVSKQIDKYQGLLAAQTYQMQRVAVANAALDQAKSVAAQRELFVVPLVKPNMPAKALYPAYIQSLITVLFVAGTVYGIAKLGLSSIRDHSM